MKNVEPSDNRDLNHLKLFFYLIPIIGFSLSDLYHHGHQGSRARPTTCSKSLVCHFVRLLAVGLFLLGIGAESEFSSCASNAEYHAHLWLLLVYWLMFRLSSGKSTRLPGFSRLAESRQALGLMLW